MNIYNVVAEWQHAIQQQHKLGKSVNEAARVIVAPRRVIKLLCLPQNNYCYG